MTWTWYLTRYDDTTDALVSELRLDITDQDVRKIFGVDDSADVLGSYEVPDDLVPVLAERLRLDLDADGSAIFIEPYTDDPC